MHVSWMPGSDHKRAYNFWMSCASPNPAQWWLCPFTHLTSLFLPEMGRQGHISLWLGSPGYSFTSQALPHAHWSPLCEPRVVVGTASMGTVKPGRYITGAGRTLFISNRSCNVFRCLKYVSPPCKRKVTSLYFKRVWNNSCVHVLIHPTAVCVGLCTELLGFWDTILASPSPCLMHRQNHEDITTL